MDENAPARDDLLDEIASCLSRVRDHVYRANVGGLVVEAGGDLFAALRAPVPTGFAALQAPVPAGSDLRASSGACTKGTDA
jgi:hypothetical protein